MLGGHKHDNIMVHILQTEKVRLKLRKPIILLGSNLIRFKPSSVSMQRQPSSALCYSGCFIVIKLSY